MSETLSARRVIGIMGGMLEEVAGLIERMTDVRPHSRGMRTYYQGTLLGHEVVVVFSRWGKVAAATTVTHLILEFGITELLFTGLSGAISADLRVGDIVIGNRFYQHDMDATPIVARFEIPLLGISSIEAAPEKVKAAASCIQSLLNEHGAIPGIEPGLRALFGIHNPRLHIGPIASGDRFFADRHEKQALQDVLPGVLCVEMEGAAVAQVCYEYGIPFLIVRTVSDASDEQSEELFLSFASQVASVYSVALVRCLLEG